MSQPSLATLSEADHPLRLGEQMVATDDPDPKALACDGLLLRAVDDPARGSGEVWLRLVAGRPISSVTAPFLARRAPKLAARGTHAVLLAWDHASGHTSREVRGWIKGHHRQGKRRGEGTRMVPCPPPTRSPWLSPIEPTWVHGRRRVIGPARLLPAPELVDRVCEAFDCPHEDHLVIPERVA